MTSNPFLNINFKQFDCLCKEFGRVDDVILYSSIYYQISKTKLSKEGVKFIARSREQLSGYICKEVKSADVVLERLVGHGFIRKTVGMWKGERRLFISLCKKAAIDVDINKLCFLTKFTGNHKSSIILSYIECVRKNRSYQRDDHAFCTISKRRLICLLKSNNKTVDRLIKKLSYGGFIHYRTTYVCGYVNYELAISNLFYEKVFKEWPEFERSFFKVDLDKKGVSIILPTKKGKKSINKINNTEEIINGKNYSENPKGDIIFLTKKDKSYITSALSRTMDRVPHLNFNKRSMTEQVIYVMSMPSYRKSTSNLKHAVNRAMKIIRDEKWKIPYGYYKYNEYGKKEKEHFTTHEGFNDVARSQNKARGADISGDVVGNNGGAIKSLSEIAGRILKTIGVRR